MKIAFNPSTVAALTSPPNNKDITFDLKGHNIFARGVEFKGTDTNTWRPVVDNLISDSTTSSLSAKQGKVLKALIDGKSNSGHTHDDRYLKLTGGVLTGNLIGTSATFSGRFHNAGDDEGIIINPAANGYAGLILGTYNGERSVFYFTKGNPFWRYNNGTNNLDIKHPKKAGTIALTSDIPNKGSWNYDDRYLKLSGGTMNSNALIIFADSGSWSTDKGPQGARGGLYWSGQSDYAKLYAEETAADNLDLVIQFGDDNSNGLSIRNKVNTQTSYISASGVITTGTFKGNLDWSYITNKPSSYTPSAHTHAWNSLTHSSTTANQAILTNGSANGWKLYTLNISAWDNAASKAHSHSNKAVIDGITSTHVSNWNTAYNFVSTISGSNTDKIINKWDEIVNFLAGIDSNNKLNTLLNSKLSVYELADKTNVGTIKNNGIYYSTTDASSSTLTNSPFSNGFALINMTSYDGGDDLRRSRLAFNAYGEIKVSDDRSQSNTTETWYNVLTSKNSGINGSTIKLNGSSITVYSSGTADGRYVKKSGDTMTGILTIDYANFGALIVKRGDDSNGASIQFRGKSNIYGYIGFNAANRNKQLLRWNDASSQVYTILDTSSTYTSSGKGIINGSEITQVSNATTAINSNRLRSNTEFALGNNFLQYFNTAGLESSGIKNAAPDKDWWHIIRMNHPNSKGYFSELAIALNSYNGVYWRTINAGKEARTWTRLANVSEIPSSLKNPNAIKFKDINGNIVTYDGSAAKDLTVGTYIAKLPYGFNSFASGPTWGNTTGTSIASWNDSTGGSIDFRRDNPSAGKMSIKVDGRVYVNEGHNPVLSAESNNGFWGMRTPDGGNDWIRTPNNGLIPCISGNAGSGHSSLGTSGWYFSTAYIDKIYGSLKGNADTASSANKLTTARNIALGTDLRGSANFDGSGNITINANINACTVSVGSTDTLPFKRIAHFETGNSWNDNALLLYISEGYINGRNGICRVEFRTDNISSSSTSITASAAVRWLVRYGYGLDSLYAGYYVTAGKAYIDIYLKTAGGYRGTVIRVLQDSRGGINSNVQLISARYNNENDHKEAYSSIEAAATALYNKAYTRIVSGSDVGTVNYANSTGSTTKLQTARKLWGQSFDGTKDISGSLSGTGSITPGSAAASDIGSNSLDYRYGYFQWIGAKTGTNLRLAANNADNQIVLHTNGNVGIGTNSPSYRLQVIGDQYTTGWSRASNGFYCQDAGVHFTHNGSVGEIAITSNNEFTWGSTSTTLYFNYRPVSRGKTVTDFVWKAGSSTSWAKHSLGALDLHGDVYWTNGDATMKIYGVDTCCGKENVAFQSTFDGKDPLTSDYVTSYRTRSAILLQPRGGNVGINVSHDPSYALTVGGDVGITGSKGKFIGDLTGNSDTTTKWKTARAFTIGNTSKNVDGSNNVSWSLSEIGAASSGHNHDNKYLRWLGSAGQSNMNAIGRISHSSGMTALADPGNTTDNPMEGGFKSTSWHLYWQTNYTDDPSGSNAWVAQIVNRAGTDRWWVRSRNGGTITNGTGWASNWRFLVTAPTSGLGNGNQPIYINSAGEVVAANSYPTSLRSPHALTLKANGTTLATYDGSSAKEANFTYANVGAASASHTHTWASITDKLVATNEFNIVNAGFKESMWFNYLPINDRNKTAAVASYIMGNGAKGYASVQASGFIKHGSNSSYVLLGDGGHAAISQLSVKYATSAGSATSATKVIVNQHTSNDINYPLVWSNQSNTSNVTENQLYKSWADLYYNPKNKRLTVGGSVVTSSFVKSGGTNQQLLRADGGVAAFNWTGQSGQPTWLWGGNDFNSYYVYNPSNFRVAYATSAGNADTLDGEHAGNFVRAGAIEADGTDLNALDTYSFIKSVNSKVTGHSPKGNNGWYNIIQAVHRNGQADGPSYIGQIALGMTVNTDDMFFRGKRTDPWKTIIHSGNISSQTVANAYHLRINSANSWSTWNWAGQGGQPSWLWGSNDGTNMYVWNPSNFNVNTAQYLRSLGNQNCQTGRTQAYSGVYTYNTHSSNTGSATTYSSVIGFGRGTSGTVEIAGGWCNTNLHWRSLRDCCEDWFAWRTVLDDSNYASVLNNTYLPLAGGTMKGNARIGHGSGSLYIGNSGNDGWLYVQDMASQAGEANWKIYANGSATFKNLTVNGPTVVNGSTTLNSVTTLNGLVTNNGGILPASYDVNKNNTACYVWGDAMSTGVTAITDALAPNYVSVNYSQNNGSSWLNAGLNTFQTFSLYANNGNREAVYLGGNRLSDSSGTDSLAQVQKNQLMVTFEIPNNLYSQLCWASIDINNGVQTVCTVEIIAKDGTIKNTFTKNLYGWNNLNYINFWGNNSAVVSIGQDSARFVRFKFKHDAGNTYVRNTLIHKIRIFSYTKHALDGGDFRSIMANTGHLYRYDENLNVTFPNAITCTTLNVGGTLSINGSVIDCSASNISIKSKESGSLMINTQKIIEYNSQAITFNRKAKLLDGLCLGTITFGSTSPNVCYSDTRPICIDVMNYDSQFIFKPATDGQLLFLKVVKRYSSNRIKCTAEGCEVVGAAGFDIYLTNGATKDIFADGKSRIFIYLSRDRRWYEFYCA